MWIFFLGKGTQGTWRLRSTKFLGYIDESEDPAFAI